MYVSIHIALLAMSRKALLACLLFASILCVCVASESDNKYFDGDEIKVFARKISPLANPYETYDYEDVAGCKLQKNVQSLTLGELLSGEPSLVLPTNIHFNRSTQNQVLCRYTIDQQQFALMTSMIRGKYRYELNIDDFPVWGALGEETENGYAVIFTHRTFYIGVNNHRVVNVTLESDSARKLEISATYDLTYSVVFTASNVPYSDRLDSLFASHDISPRTRFISLINSGLIVLFLISIITLIFSRTLRLEHAKMERDAQLRFDGQDIIDESGWRCLYADVFRVPQQTTIFCAILGSGAQLLLLTSLNIFLSVMSNHRISINRDLVTYSVLGYVFTSCIAGYVSGYQFMACGFLAPPMASKWIRAFHITFLLVPLIYATAFLPSGAVTLIYGSSHFPYFKGIVILVCLWVFIAYPLCLAGVLCSRYVFRRTERRRNIPHVNQIPRLVPRTSRKILAPRYLFLFSGVFPFITVFLEFRLVFNSMWTSNILYLYGFLAATLLLYVAVTACVSVVATFLLLSTENHYWKWMSMGFGASSTVYIFVYAVFFYFFKTSMHGFFMFLVYYSYCLAFGLFLALVGGSVGYFAASFFVRLIYAQAKHE